MNCFYNNLSNEFVGESQYLDRLLQVMWHITSECNLNCKMCFSRALKGTTGAISKNRIKQTVELLYELGVQKVDLSGGEPLLFEFLEDVVNQCVDHRISPTITTSGFGKDSIIDWIVSNNRAFSRIILSLDGPKAIHNILRGHTNAYLYFTRFYDRIKNAKYDRVRINTVVSNLLIQSKDEYCTIINGLEPFEVCCIQPHPINKIGSFDEYASTEDEFFTFVEYIKSHISNNIRVLQRNRHDFASYWTLYPNNYLCHLSEGNEFQQRFLLLPENLPKIIEAVKNSPQTYIKGNSI